ncbi:MAG: XRE family transcriptional regulator [bacterium]|nr:XRE family transcriptional regulator [bacterium]
MSSTSSRRKPSGVSQRRSATSTSSASASKKRVATRSKEDENPKVTASSGNVFADLGLPDADEMFRKAEIVTKIDRLIDGRGLSQRQVAKITGLSQPDVSRLWRGMIDGFSLERLLGVLAALGVDIEIRIGRTPRRGHARGRVTVTAA